MSKNIHEIRDPIHVFIRLDSDERKVLDSRPFQRLRNIHQLGLSCFVYPGATHTRFEHSLGVMELAGRVFDVVTRPEAVNGDIKSILGELADKDKLAYWRRVLRMAALCHDVGHLPFSHTAEELLPDAWSHERLTAEIVKSEGMVEIWRAMTPPLRVEDIVKLAVGPKSGRRFNIGQFSDWEAILAEIIVGDAFGVDRIDYLLRDSHHAGVAYGRFDHYRLIDTLRILPPPRSEKNGSQEPMLGVEEGGLHSAEALLLARYFMFTQVYCHPVRRIYDIHLKDFLAAWLPGGQFPTGGAKHLAMTDAEVMTALRKAAFNRRSKVHEEAQRIVGRRHFKVLYERNPEDIRKNREAVEEIFRAAAERFGADQVRKDRYSQRAGPPDFPVLTRDHRVVSSLVLSQTLERLPAVATGYVFIDPALRDDATKWLERNREAIVALKKEDER